MTQGSVLSGTVVAPELQQSFEVNFFNFLFGKIWFLTLCTLINNVRFRMVWKKTIIKCRILKIKFFKWEIIIIHSQERASAGTVDQLNKSAVKNCDSKNQRCITSAPL
jgi:hypothetical protein